MHRVSRRRLWCACPDLNVTFRGTWTALHFLHLGHMDGISFSHFGTHERRFTHIFWEHMEGISFTSSGGAHGRQFTHIFRNGTRSNQKFAFYLQHVALRLCRATIVPYILPLW